MEKRYEGRPHYPGEVEGHLVKSISDISKYSDPVFYTSDFTIDHTIILDKVKAIIAKRGSWSTHVAIVSREFKIPSVLGVDLDDVPDGARVKVVSPKEWFVGDGINRAVITIYY